MLLNHELTETINTLFRYEYDQLNIHEMTLSITNIGRRSQIEFSVLARTFRN